MLRPYMYKLRKVFMFNFADGFTPVSPVTFISKTQSVCLTALTPIHGISCATLFPSIRAQCSKQAISQVLPNVYLSECNPTAA